MSTLRGIYIRNCCSRWHNVWKTTRQWSSENDASHPEVHSYPEMDLHSKSQCWSNFFNGAKVTDQLSTGGWNIFYSCLNVFLCSLERYLQVKRELYSFSPCPNPPFFTYLLFLSPNARYNFLNSQYFKTFYWQNTLLATEYHLATELCVKMCTFSILGLWLLNTSS